MGQGKILLQRAIDAAAAMLEAGKALQQNQQNEAVDEKQRNEALLAQFERPEVSTNDFSLELLLALSWNRFEALCGAYFAAHGFRAEQRSYGADGGIDISLYFKDIPTPVKLIQCKGWRRKRVDVEPIRSLLGVMTRDGVKDGVFVTMSSFTRPAMAEAAAARIMTIDGEAMVNRLRTLDGPRKAALLQIATEGQYWRPSCARCGGLMKPVTNVDRPFWGCSNYGRLKCRSKIELLGA
ncbi:restriction endonuclease [Cupriavidus pauculus]|uniref:restriction endonuclease n=1 Tax=Cupriavidus pauculus TaxID=82633 RepID=UPI001EE2B4FD|nr:restriction endonuclease [Cupriavidus pauculus]GJG98502.1 restriction endonuclease [Cupriavidus pauculus]